MPPEGYLVLIVLADGTELHAYWYAGNWWTGVENDPADVRVSGDVVSWRSID